MAFPIRSGSCPYRGQAFNLGIGAAWNVLGRKRWTRDCPACHRASDFRYGGGWALLAGLVPAALAAWAAQSRSILPVAVFLGSYVPVGPAFLAFSPLVEGGLDRRQFERRCEEGLFERATIADRSRRE